MSVNKINPITGAPEKIADRVQYDVMPANNLNNYVGMIVQFIGATNNTYTHGFFYECVSDGAASPTYSWEEVDFGDSTPHWTGTRAEYEAQKDNIPEGAYVALTDDIDSTYESGDYSLNEVNTGKRWIDGKPIYRKVFTDIPFPEEADIVQDDTSVTSQTTDVFPGNYIGDIVNTSFVAINRTYGHQYSLPRRWQNSNPDTSEPIVIWIDAGIASEDPTLGYTIEVRSNRTSFSNENYKLRAIIEYTKND